MDEDRESGQCQSRLLNARSQDRGSVYVDYWAQDEEWIT